VTVRGAEAGGYHRVDARTGARRDPCGDRGHGQPVVGKQASLEEIGSPDRIDDWVRAKITSGDRVMGFGHTVYRTEDPHSVMLREIAVGLGGELVEFATTVERRVVEILAELKPGRELYANVEFYAGVVMELSRPWRPTAPPTARSRSSCSSPFVRSRRI
jgi:citrate synthase